MTNANPITQAIAFYDEIEAGQRDHELDALEAEALRSGVPCRALLPEAIRNRRAALRDQELLKAIAAAGGRTKTCDHGYTFADSCPICD
jgi:hypothetical protein